jgi:RimJ/RimL family protein N-acetyltransferase
MSKEQPDRDARLAQSLRENLHRRKAQTRENGAKEGRGGRGLPEAPRLVTERAILRGQVYEDFQSFLEMWADPVVTEYFGHIFTRSESWTRFLRSIGLWPVLGYGYWTAEDRATGDYLGVVGIGDFERGIPDIVGIPEAGWVLAAAAHGRGLATEMVSAIIAWADANIDAPETCCIIAPGNRASFRVAEKMGYVRGPTVPFEKDEIVVLTRPRGG